MNIDIFQSAKGDCLLLEAGSGERVLCDGGMASSMKAHVRDELAKLRDAGIPLEYVYVSHIDSDHISGVLQLLQDEVEWRVFDHHEQQGTPIKRPKVPRPPEIKGILHNAFRDQIGKNSKPIEELLAATAPSLFATAVPRLVAAAEEMQKIATSIPEALKVSRLIAADALDIPVNLPPGAPKKAELLFAGQATDRFDIGSMRFTLVGPTKNELEDLRDGWQTWLRANRDTVRKLRVELKRRIDDFSAGAAGSAPFDLRDWNGIPDFKGVTAPNIASLMYMVEDGGKRVLLTGDAQQDFILAGLKRAGFMPNGSVHLDVLKVQHHGSENNLDEDFARKVSADHYVLCGNGEHANPDLRVIDMIFASRLGKQSVRALAAPANRPFRFWFSTTSDAQPHDSEQREVFEKLERHVRGLVNKSNGSLTATFNPGASVRLSL